MKKGTIVLAVFPFTDLSSIKRRPALVISNDNEDKKDVIIAFISSVISAKLLPTDLIISGENKDFGKTGLHKTSVVKFDKIMTIEKTLLVGEIGDLPVDFIDEADEKLRIVFGL